MYQYWRSNRNVILTAVAIFVVSMTALMFFLTAEKEHKQYELKANVVDSLSLKSHEQEESSYRELINNQNDPLVVVNLEGGIKLSSWNFEQISGFTVTELEGEQFFSLIHPDDLPAFIGDFGKTISSEEVQSIVGPYRMYTSSEEYRLIMASLYPIFEEGKVHDIAIVSRDITNNIAPTEETGSESQKEDNESENEPIETPEGVDDTKIRDKSEEDDTRLIVDKLASLMESVTPSE